MGVRNRKRELLRRLDSKTLDARFLKEIEQGLNCSPFEAHAVLDVVKEVYFPFLDEQCVKAPPGKITLIAVNADEPAGKPVAECEKQSVCLDEQDYYTGPPKPSELITRSTELLLGLINHDDKAKKSIKSVGIKLNDKLDTAEQNIRMFLAIKTILDTAAEAVGLDIPGDKGMLVAPNIRLGAYIDLYNFRFEELQEKRLPWESAETRLNKALKMLSLIDSEKLKPSPDCLKELKDNILKDAKGEEWLRTKLLSIECGDGFNFEDVWNR